MMNKKTKAWLVMRLIRKVEAIINPLGVKTEIPLTFIDGMLGAMPVFETRKQAEDYAGDKYEVVEVVIVDIDQEGVD